MKKAFIILTALALALLCGCGYSEAGHADKVLEFIYLDNGWSIARDTRTGVQYLRAYKGGVCVMVNPDGTPYTGEED